VKISLVEIVLEKFTGQNGAGKMEYWSINVGGNRHRKGKSYWCVPSISQHHRWVWHQEEHLNKN